MCNFLIIGFYEINSANGFIDDLVLFESILVFIIILHTFIDNFTIRYLNCRGLYDYF